MSRYSVLFSKSANPELANTHLKIGSFVLGRSSSCDYVVNDASVSRRHANITLPDDSLTIVDLGSSNHTFLDGQIVESCTVKSGQSLRFGNVAFTYLTWKDEVNGSDEETDQGEALEDLFDPADELSAMQSQILNEVLCGFDEKVIATRVHRSPHTVHNHLRVIYRVFNVHSRAELLAKILKKSRRF
jgi:DNA-binding NarL/FixJ family response regulator